MSFDHRVSSFQKPMEFRAAVAEWEIDSENEGAKL